MAVNMELGPVAALVLQPSPEVILVAETLALPAGALDATVEEELATNPALRRDPAPAPACVPGWDASAPSIDVAERFADDPTDEERLLAAVRLLLPAREHALAEAVVGSLDSRLFLPIAPDELARELGVPTARVASVVAALRQAGPPGTAARNLRECLLAQLDELGAELPSQTLIRAVVEDHLEALAAGRLGDIARALKVEVRDVAAAWELMRARLRPCAVIEAHAARMPTTPPPPELAFRDSPRGGYDVEILEAARFRLSVDPLYERAAREIPGQVALRGDLQRARRFLHRLEGRWQTLRALGEALALHQDAFLHDGHHHLRPLTRAQIARELGVHESTISRAVSGKHAALPDGRVIALAEFFAGGHEAMDALRDLIAREPRPLSDAVLAEAMRRRGFPVARRTVAKYRSVLAIPPMTRRATGGQGALS
jgi:RNA polymerase sigma-54 factor